MRYYFLIVLPLTFFSYSYAQTTVAGYYVTAGNDTTEAQIKLPKSVLGSVDLSKFIFKVDVIDRQNGEKKFKPDDIKGFGFTYNGENYKLFSKPTITEKNLRFLQPVVSGARTSLYQFQTVGQNGAPLGTFYTFEKADGTFVFLNTGIKNLGIFKSTLKEFYKDNLELQQLIETKFQSRADIKNDILEIVKAANR